MKRTLLYAAALVAALTSFAPTRATAQATPDTAAARQKREKAPLPLEASRKIRLAVDEGTWLSVDVSPDGSTVVFDLLGDLYTVPLAGGRATRLTRGLAFDAQPRYSPDGTKVLFISDRSGGENLWTLDVATGDTTQITKGNGTTWMSPEWTPDGQYVVASKAESRLGVHRLWMGHVSGGAGKVLRPEPQTLKTVGAAVSPDGRWIWHAQRTGSWNYNAQLPQYQLAAYDRETGQSYSRTDRYGSAFRPTLSRDGKWLAYGTRHETETGLRIRDLATGDERWLAYPVTRDDQESVADRDVYPGMDFTPDCKELVASYGGKIWRIPLDGSTPVAVPFAVDEEIEAGPELSFDYPVEDTPRFTVRQIRDAVPSPDGLKLAFTALDELYVMDYPDGAPRRLAASPGVIQAFPAWSPDGIWVAYVTWSPEGGQIFKVRADGRAAALQLTRQSAEYEQIAWTPDGQRIVAVRNPARAYHEAYGTGIGASEADLVWVSATGGEATLIAPADGRQAPHFVQGSDRLWLHHGQKGLVSIRMDGTDEKAHVKVTGATRPGQQQPDRADIILMAPRGDQALAQVYNDLYVVTVPKVGGEAPTISVSDPSSAAFPARRLTDIGGQFPAWDATGRKVHWSVGNAHFVYDLDAAQAHEDSVKAAARAAARDTAAADTTAAKKDTDKGFEPAERRIHIEAERDLPRGTVVLRGARVITMGGAGVVEDADVIVTDNRISAVGRRGSVSLPQGAKIIDVSGKTIIPGFVDTHSHMWPTWGVHKTQSWLYLANLAYGVTTTRDPQTSTTDVLTYADLVTAGRMLGPRVYSTGPGIFGDYAEDAVKDLAHARDIVRRYSRYYDTKTIKMYMAGNRQQRQWIIMAAREQQMMPTTEGGLQMMYDLTMALDGYPGQEHTLPITPIYGDVVKLFSATGITYTPTLLVSYGGPWAENWFYANENPHDDAKLAYFTAHEELDQKSRRRAAWFRDDEHVFRRHAEGLRKVVEDGGRIGVGSHGQLQGLGYHWELWAMQSGGMSSLDALRAATILGAEAIGLDRDVGSVEVGKLADLIILGANPLDDIRNTNTITHVMMNGRLFEGNTLNEVWPRPRALERKDWVVPEPKPGVEMRR
jgi:Tol biopolymer transport system component